MSSEVRSDEILRWLASGAISILSIIAVFTARDLYRRLCKVEEAGRETEKSITILQVTMQQNAKTLEEIAKDVRSLVCSHGSQLSAEK